MRIECQRKNREKKVVRPADDSGENKVSPREKGKQFIFPQERERERENRREKGENERERTFCSGGE